MIFAFVRLLIGNFGRAFMDFYIDNGLVINGIILFYALLITITHRNYFIALENIIIELRNSNESLKNKEIKKINTSEYKNIRWETAKKSIWFPLISRPKKWVFSLCTSYYLKNEFTLEKLNQFLSHAKKE